MTIIDKPIEMIASYDIEGNIKPLRYKVVENDMNNVVEVEHVLKSNNMPYNGMMCTFFTCKSVINGKMKLYELVYLRDTCVWKIHKF